MDEKTTIKTLSSMGPNSYLSTKDATKPDIKPHSGIPGSAIVPIKYPRGRHNAAIPTLPHALFVRLLNILLRIIPVTPSPNAMNNEGRIAKPWFITVLPNDVN